MIQAVLFDMDGTLIDTEKYYRIFWPKALAACGYTMTDEQALTMRSLGRPLEGLLPPDSSRTGTVKILTIMWCVTNEKR